MELQIDRGTDSIHVTTSILSHKVSFRLDQVDLDRKATQDINVLINKLQIENTKQIEIEERFQEKIIRESVKISCFKIEYLI